jgi:chlorobactene glucosyltransferase
MILEILFYSTLVLSTVTTIISIYNFFTAPRIRGVKDQLIYKPFISILIPARDEEINIENCIEDVMNQSYNNYELLILDDESTDETAKIVTGKISERRDDDKIKLISGKPKPNDWIGKNWACHQLSLEARGEILLFIDADVRIRPHVIESCIYYMDKYKLRLLTCFSTQKIKLFGEWLVVPLMNFLLLTFLPLTKVYSSTKKSFVAANGQFLLITKEVYNKIGGHKEVANKIVEDMEMARRFKKSGFKLMTFLGENSITCRMYYGFEPAFNGFTKNFFPGFNTSPLIFIFFLLFLFTTFFLPYLFVFMNSYFIWIVLIILLGRLATSISSHQSIVANFLLHPIQMIIMIAIGLNSIYRTTTKKMKWKGRSI